MGDYKQLAQELYETLEELSDYLDYEKLPLSVAIKLALYLRTLDKLAQEHPTRSPNALYTQKPMTAFTYKGYGRIYTNPEYIQEVENIIQELNKFEWSYYPGGLVTSWDRYPNVEYVGKFELDEEKFKELCKERNIPVFIFDAGMNDYPSGYTKTLNVEEIKEQKRQELLARFIDEEKELPGVK